MNPYSYRISLTLRHSSEKLTEVSEQIIKLFPEIIPGQLCNIGEDRMTPIGRKLEGMYTDSRFSFAFSEETYNSKLKTLEDSINEVLEKLILCKDLLLKFTSKNGSIEFFIGLFVDANSGIVLDTDLIKRLADLKIGLGFDIYPPEK